MKKKIAIMLLLVLGLTTITSCGKGDDSVADKNVYPQLEDVKKGDPIAVINTNMGSIKLRFFPEYAPKAVENFLTHAEEGYYDGVTFHRVINEFMIQGGDPLGTGTGGESIWGEDFENEVSVNLRHFRGALSMANAGPDTNSSQFFIVQAGPETAAQSLYTTAENDKDNFPEEVIKGYEELGGTPFLDFGYSVFGQVYEGMDVVDKIAQLETDGHDKPLEDVIIESIETGTY